MFGNKRYNKDFDLYSLFKFTAVIFTTDCLYGVDTVITMQPTHLAVKM